MRGGSSGLRTVIALILTASPLAAADSRPPASSSPNRRRSSRSDSSGGSTATTTATPQVAVTYRKQGEQAWKAGPPLLRIGNERINENALQYVTPNGFAGSVFDLDPATVYEARFVLSDPDGVDGRAEQVVSVRTRAEPMPAAGGKVYHVYPPGYEGQRQEPAFTGLLARLLHRLIAFGQLQHLSASRAAGRHDPRPRRHLQGRSAPVRRRPRARYRAAPTSSPRAAPPIDRS